MSPGDEVFRIAQISDLHCGEPYFEASLLERAIGEINELQPDVVVCSGDLTTFGFRHEYLAAREYLDRIDCDSLVVVPGNHDSRNVGYVHFEELFGERNSVLAEGRRRHRRRRLERARPRPRPDRPWALPLDRGAVRARSADDSGSSSSITICSPCREPAGSGTSSTTRATPSSACSAPASGSCSRATSTFRTSWRLEDLFVVNAGTVSSLRLRGKTRPCYNVIEIADGHVDVWRRHPFHGQVKLVRFSLDTLEYAKFTGAIEDEVTTRT